MSGLSAFGRGDGSTPVAGVEDPHAAAEQKNDQDVRSIPHVDRTDGEGQSAYRDNQSLSALGQLGTRGFLAAPDQSKPKGKPPAMNKKPGMP